MRCTDFQPTSAESGQYHNQSLNTNFIRIFYETNVLPLNPALYFMRSLKRTNRSYTDPAVYFQIAHDESTCVRVTPSHCIHHMNPVTQNVARTVNL
jgi:hypothetical protein